MKRIWITAIVGLVVALVLGVALSPFASSHPDGLERVAEDKGFIGKSEQVFGGSPMPDYTVRGANSEASSTRLAGLIGTVTAFGGGVGIAVLIRALRRRMHSQ
jgi:cobalt/nickel transport protein